MGEKSEFVPVHVKWSLDLMPQGEIIHIPDKKLKVYRVSPAEIERLEEFWRKNRMGDYAGSYPNGDKRSKKQVYADNVWKDEADGGMDAVEPVSLVAENAYIKTSKGGARTARQKRCTAINKKNSEKPEDEVETQEQITEREVVGI